MYLESLNFAAQDFCAVLGSHSYVPMTKRASDGTVKSVNKKVQVDMTTRNADVLKFVEPDTAEGFQAAFAHIADLLLNSMIIVQFHWQNTP